MGFFVKLRGSFFHVMAKHWNLQPGSHSKLYDQVWDELNDRKPGGWKLHRPAFHSALVNESRISD
jgi:hypothetical protein